MRRLINALFGGPMEFRVPEDEAYVAAELRKALAELQAKGGRDRRAAQAVHSYYVLNRPARRQDVARGLRRLRYVLKGKRTTGLLAHLRPALPLPSIPPTRPRNGWVSVKEAAALTGYSEEHIRNWVLPRHPRIRRRVAQGAIFVRQADIVAYKAKQVRRGYGPKRRRKGARK